MELPPGRVERISDGGPDAVRTILADLRAMKFNGILKTSVFRGDTPSQGLLVFRAGDGVLAEHRAAEDVLGPEAVAEILRDASSERAQLEVRTYDYGHSSISVDQLEKTHPEAAIGGLGYLDASLGHVLQKEAAAREVYLKDLEARRSSERKLIEKEEELYRRKWELEQEFQRSAMRQRELESLRAELQGVKEASGMLLRHLEATRTAGDVELESQKKIAAIEAERIRAELEAQRAAGSARAKELDDRGRELAGKEALLRDREAALDA